MDRYVNNERPRDCQNTFIITRFVISRFFVIYFTITEAKKYRSLCRGLRYKEFRNIEVSLYQLLPTAVCCPKRPNLLYWKISKKREFGFLVSGLPFRNYLQGFWHTHHLM